MGYAAIVRILQRTCENPYRKARKDLAKDAKKIPFVTIRACCQWASEGARPTAGGGPALPLRGFCLGQTLQQTGCDVHHVAVLGHLTVGRELVHDRGQELRDGRACNVRRNSGRSS